MRIIGRTLGDPQFTLHKRRPAPGSLQAVPLQEGQISAGYKQWATGTVGVSKRVRD